MASANRIPRVVTAVSVILFSTIVLTGCKTDARRTGPSIAPEEHGFVGSLENPSGYDLPNIPVTNRNEVDLVEQTILHRAMYIRHLRVLVQFYTEHGNLEKASWARNELQDAQQIKPYMYITDNDSAIAQLQPTESIAEADQLYDEGLALMKRGGHGVPGFYHQGTMKQAMAKFKMLIEVYPTSDKIDDAAFQIGELHKEYFEEKDNSLALHWYRRAITWDPNTPHPVRFQMAAVYDYRLKDHERALEMYQAVVREETFNESNVDWANARITELTRKATREAGGEALPRENVGTGGEAAVAGPPAPPAP